MKPDHGDFSPELAREILSLQLGDADQARMRELSCKAQAGTLTASEQDEVENYRWVGYWLGILWSKAMYRPGLFGQLIQRKSRTLRWLATRQRGPERRLCFESDQGLIRNHIAPGYGLIAPSL
jgi:hypothetical protein